MYFLKAKLLFELVCSSLPHSVPGVTVVVILAYNFSCEIAFTLTCQRRGLVVWICSSLYLRSDIKFHMVRICI